MTYPTELDKLYPHTNMNNARDIVINALHRMKRHPSDVSAQQLEAFGITVDYSDTDWGNEPQNYQE